jgi:hypothetical protein
MNVKLAVSYSGKEICLSVYYNRMLRKLLWLNKTKGTWGWRKHVNESLMIYSPCQLRIFQWWNQGGWTISVCDTEEKNNVYRDLEGEIKEKRPPESPRRRRSFNTARDLKETSGMTFTKFRIWRLRQWCFRWHKWEKFLD